MSSDAALIIIGLWQGYDEDREWPHPRSLVDSPIPNKHQLVGYLRSGVRVHEDLGYSYCRFDDGPPDHEMGNADMTDGTWLWPEGLWIYVDRYDVRVPAEFAEHARKNDYQHPPNLDVDGLEERPVDMEFWRQWCRDQLQPT